MIILKKQITGYEFVDDEIKAAIVHCQNDPECDGIDFAGLRKENAKTVDEWPDGYIHQAAIDLGLDVNV
jgi:hypothetical protein